MANIGGADHGDDAWRGAIGHLVLRPLKRLYAFALLLGVALVFTQATAGGAGAARAFGTVATICLAGVLMALVIALPVLLIHEVGHLLAARLVGASPRHLYLGGCGGGTRRALRWGRLPVTLSLPVGTSCTAFDPPLDARSRGRFALVMLAGPATTGGVGLILGTLAGGWDVTTVLFGFTDGRAPAQALMILALGCFIDAGYSFVPYQTAAGAHSDGFALLALARAAITGRGNILVETLAARTHHAADTSRPAPGGATTPAVGGAPPRSPLAGA